MIDKDKAAEVFAYMDDDQQQALLGSFTNQEVGHILDAMYTDVYKRQADTWFRNKRFMI